MDRGRDVPGWYWLAAIGALLFELLGCVVYLSQVTADPASLQVDQRALWASTPTWMVAAYGTAVWVGLAGAVALLFRRRWAMPLLLVALVAVVVQFSGLLLVPALRSQTSSNGLLVPILIIVVSVLLVRFAHHARRRRWLR